MSLHNQWKPLHDARQAVIDALIEKYNTVLFGTPPTRTSTGKLTGATPPNMALLTRLFKN